MINVDRNEELLDIDKDFRRTYHSELLPNLKKLEFVRIILFSLFCICSLFILVFWGMHFYQYLTSSKYDLIELIIIILEPFLFVSACFTFFDFVLNLFLKKKLLTILLKPFKFFEANKYYEITSEQLKESKIIEKHLFKFNPEKIDGTYKGVKIRYNTAMLFDYVRSGYSNGKRRYKLKNVFSGYLIEMDMNKRFSGHTILLDGYVDNGEDIFSFLGLNPDKMDKVELEDPEFEDYFYEIRSTDQVEARYILTPTMMERLKKLYKRLENILRIRECRLSFLENKVLMAFKLSSFNKMLRLCSLLKPLDKQDREICAFKDSLLVILEIVDVLKLDTRLGL